MLILAVLAGWQIIRLQQQLDVNQDRSACITRQRTEEAAANQNNDIAYNDYVLALGGQGDVGGAQEAIAAATAELVRVRDNGLRIEETCGS